MRINNLRHIIYIQTPTTSLSTRGAETITWADSPLLRGRVRTVSGDERRTNDLVIPVAAHEIEMRWPLPTGTSISTKSRIRWRVEGADRYFGITAIGEPDNLRRRIVLTCQELVGESRVI